MKEETLKLRNKRKAKKPKFIRQDAHKKAKVSEKWRKPKGLQSKMRYGKKGYRRSVKSGYGSPAAAKGLTRDGFEAVNVSCIGDLKSITEGQAALISSRVGQKKRAEIAKKADELGIKIINIKDVQEYLKSVSETMQKKKEEKQKHVKEKEKKKAEKEKKAEEKKKEDLAEKLTDEEKKAEEKKERDKMLTKKEN